jgi:uncharacterized protein (DUF1778 family)
MLPLQAITDEKRTARIEQRVSPRTKNLIEHAAALQGLTASEFMIAHGVSAAQDTINRLEGTRLAAEDRKAFLQAFDDESANDSLIDLFALHARVTPNA